VTKHYHL